MPPFKKKPLRRPDGTPETRTPDEMLADAVAGEDLTILPGAGQPVDLAGYFASGPEHRMANRILRDNQVLPQPLQERRDAENLQAEAEAYLERQQQQLGELFAQLESATAALCAPFTSRDALLQTLGWSEWPTYFSEPTAAPLPRLHIWLKQAQVLSEYIATYNRRIEIGVAHYMDLLAKANACIERLNKQVLFSHQLTPGLQLRPLKIEDFAATAHEQWPRLELLPADLRQRLTAHYRRVQPTLWQRVFSR
jgi:hypothetical protein